MIDIKELNHLSKILNLHQLCGKSGLKYKTIYKRLERYRKNNTHGKISEQDATQLREGLQAYSWIFDKK